MTGIEPAPSVHRASHGCTLPRPDALVTGRRPTVAGMTTASVSRPLARRALGLGAFTIAYNLVEGIVADATETRLCAVLSVTTFLSLLLYLLLGWTWLDPVAGFVIAVFAVMEGREAWEGELVEEHDH